MSVEDSIGYITKEWKGQQISKAEAPTSWKRQTIEDGKEASVSIA